MERSCPAAPQRRRRPGLRGRDTVHWSPFGQPRSVRPSLAFAEAAAAVALRLRWLVLVSSFPRPARGEFNLKFGETHQLANALSELTSPDMNEGSERIAKFHFRDSGSPCKSDLLSPCSQSGESFVEVPGRL